MIQPQGIIALEEDVTVSEAIMRCLIEVVCPEAMLDAKHMALQKVEELHSGAHSWHVADILRTLLGSVGVSVRNVLLRCGADIQRLRTQRAREPARVHALRGQPSQSMGNAESDALRNARELQTSREKLNTYTRLIEALEDELRRMRPSYDMGDKFRASRIGAVIHGTTTPSTNKRDSGETVRKDKKAKDGVVVSKKNDGTEITNG
ncbi:hypothetical protein LSM04_009504 [Trypanosoma melophagium]|uniref:uncharacterized protein n=1 Tax=Trypanosoma melophagium TaxID=715481 RepID=UPI00351AAE60|nr:hypothetical protein LSM04_009504 [Trypanosoma melophagium]